MAEMTLITVKDRVAQRNGFRDWSHFLFNKPTIEKVLIFSDQIAELYAMNKAVEATKKRDNGQ
ncbi:hypothetical protein DN752_19495 [Echinicola strongylocentroti]|uniref:Uncharacterized protein n=1 Tax=Echinicola strongylocentroti TaxID=1795355 RepID=A0A2Z4INC5_9BACT|nr:hypothetical protein [Echinicola strongylocentroti]AWW32148.1 hypothetical protein DN752_19495 [Echinicola strongylocentroti]